VVENIGWNVAQLVWYLCICILKGRVLLNLAEGGPRYMADEVLRIGVTIYTTQS
jgi:hypothetical protein